MKLVTTWFGVFIIEDDKVLEHMLFPKDAEQIASRMQAIQKGRILAEEEELATGKQLFVFDERLDMVGELLFDNPPFISPEDYDFSSQLLNRAMIIVGKDMVRTSGSPDQQILQAIRAMDDLDKTNNLLSERLHEWHEINFPELPKLVSEQDYVKLIAEHGDRETILANTKLDIPDSMGSDIEPEDGEAMKRMAINLISAVEARQTLEKFVQNRMEAFAPNTSHIAGPLIGARLISLAGGMERLAKMPTSTVQILGAEKAFFKHIKEKVKPPKHGIIFQNPLVHRAPYWQRGNIARALASKISMAVKVDHFGDRLIFEKLEKDLERKVAEIKKKYPEAPKKKKGQPSQNQGQRQGQGRPHKNKGNKGRGRDGQRGSGRRYDDRGKR
ncbi:MAG: ribosomal biogenesis protein [Thermoplasmata archaeon]|nr:ribosomal biogenesis protein [Thermoplasmata archaeon]